LSGDFFLVPAAQVVTANAPAAGEAAIAWGATKDTTSPAVLDAFIRQFEGTVYASMARARLGELQRTQSAAVLPPPAPSKATAPAAPVPPGPPAAETKPASSAAVAVATPKPETRSAPSVYEAAQAWAAARETNRPADLETFLTRFGNTIYGPMAHDRLEQLKNTHVAVVAPPAPAPSAPAATPAVGVFSPSRSATPLTAAEERALKPQDSFTECARCPEMVVVPPGSYTMGSPAGEAGHSANEAPQTPVTLANP
jgi:hypothetical protein